MKPIFTLGNIIASLFMIYIGIRLLTIHEQSDFLPKYVTIILGVLILFLAIGGLIARTVNHFKKDKQP
ncbi:hypothetical protein [Flavobacterium sp. UBA6135]|uniref:hypothetical protein n=1 Tax=Flavobacterium sp. UBA6135 TaxID=1946553 RepID=UPI0025C613CA|nr:hypothetical protein [Flavobacterium sp. UBA6135]